MNEYLLSVLGTVLLCSILTAIVPEGKTSSVIKGVARLACVLTIIAPVLYFFETGNFGENEEENFLENVITTDDAFIQYYSEERVRAAEAALCKELQEEYPLTKAVTLEWTIEKETFGKGYTIDGIRIQRICVEVEEGASEEVKENMSSYLTKNYCSEVLME